MKHLKLWLIAGIILAFAISVAPTSGRETYRDAGGSFNPAPGGDGAQQIVDKSADYQILVDDDIVNMTGSVTATLPDIAIAVQQVTITCITGRTTVVGDAPIQPPSVLTTRSSITVYPSAGEWRQK